MGSMIIAKSRTESEIAEGKKNATVLMQWPLIDGSHVFRGGTHCRQGANVHAMYHKAFTNPTSPLLRGIFGELRMHDYRETIS